MSTSRLARRAERDALRDMILAGISADELRRAFGVGLRTIAAILGDADGGAA